MFFHTNEIVHTLLRVANVVNMLLNGDSGISISEFKCSVEFFWLRKKTTQPTKQTTQLNKLKENIVLYLCNELCYLFK